MYIWIENREYGVRIACVYDVRIACMVFLDSLPGTGVVCALACLCDTHLASCDHRNSSIIVSAAAV